MATPVTAYRDRASQGAQAWALHEGGRYEPARESAVHGEGPHHGRARRDVAQLRRPPRGQQADAHVWVIATTYEGMTSLHLAHFVCLWPKGCLRKRASRLSLPAAPSTSCSLCSGAPPHPPPTGNCSPPSP